jgi:hypothetical protein
MGAVKGAMLLLVLCVLLATGPAYAKGLQAAADAELDSIHARGLAFLIDPTTLLGTNVPGSGGVVSTSPVNMTFNGTNNLGLKNSIMLSGNAQQSALAPVNAINSALNVPINIVVVYGNVATGGVNISNILSAINGR